MKYNVSVSCKNWNCVEHGFWDLGGANTIKELKGLIAQAKTFAEDCINDSKHYRYVDIDVVDDEDNLIEEYSSNYSND